VRGDEIWSSGRGIWATSLSGKSRLVWNSPGGFLQDIGRDGRVLCLVNSSRREIVGVSAGDPMERNLTCLNWSFPTDISPDGKAVLFEDQNINPPGVYLRKLDGSPAVRIGGGASGGLSPDGLWVLTIRQAESGQFTLLPTGAGEPKVLARSGINCQGVTWFPDGRRILISGNEPGRGSRLFVQDIPDGKPRAITPEGVAVFFHAVAPDGKSVVATGTDRRVAIYPVEPGEPRTVPGMEPDELPIRWRADGLSLLVYHRPRRRYEWTSSTWNRDAGRSGKKSGPPIRPASSRSARFRSRRMRAPTCIPTGARSMTSIWRRG
jgi:dipeptidyl aminopeptidase/acylaminoacyl peptidase